MHNNNIKKHTCSTVVSRVTLCIKSSSDTGLIRRAEIDDFHITSSPVYRILEHKSDAEEDCD
jgi:hypothetical protein